MAVVWVKVREDYRWSKVRIAGREFAKQGELMSEKALTEEMVNSPLLVIEMPESCAGTDVAEPDIEPVGMVAEGFDATDAARALAAAHDIDLWSLMPGSGVGGRITKGDVQEAIDGE